MAERRVVATIKRHFAEKVAAAKLELLDKVPLLGCLTDAHKALLADALEQVTAGAHAHARFGAYCLRARAHVLRAPLPISGAPTSSRRCGDAPARNRPMRAQRTQVLYAPGQAVWAEKERADLFYIVKEGSALMRDADGATLSKLGPGGCFGQQSLLEPGALLLQHCWCRQSSGMQQQGVG